MENLIFDSRVGRISLIRDFRIFRKYPKGKGDLNLYYSNVLITNGIGVLKDEMQKEYFDLMAVNLTRIALGIILSVLFGLFFIANGLFVYLPVLILPLVMSYINHVFLKNNDFESSLMFFDWEVEFFEKLNTGYEDLPKRKVFKELYITYSRLWK